LVVFEAHFFQRHHHPFAQAVVVFGPVQLSCWKVDVDVVVSGGEGGGGGGKESEREGGEREMGSRQKEKMGKGGGGKGKKEGRKETRKMEGHKNEMPLLCCLRMRNTMGTIQRPMTSKDFNKQ
jgi:hypothetical protein